MKTNNANESKIGWLHKVTNELNALTKRKDVLAEETASSEKMKQGIIDEISALSIKKNKMLSEVDKYNMTLVELHKNKKALLKELQDNKDQREKEIESFNSTTNQKEKELDKLKGHLNSQIDLLYDREKLVKEREETLKLSEGETEQKKEELEEGVKQLNEARKESSDKAIQAQKNYEYADVKVKESQAIVSKVHEKLDALKVMEDRRDAILLEREEAVKKKES
jgi:chromosome segregation ATPase